MAASAIKLPDGGELRVPLEDNVEGSPVSLTHALQDYGEFKLLMELFGGTLRQAVQYRTMRGKWTTYDDETREGVLDALAWILRVEPLPWLYSLDSIADILNLDAQRIRRKVFRAIDMGPTQIIAVLQREGWTCA